jgi:hypothetical protein
MKLILDHTQRLNLTRCWARSGQTFGPFARSGR